MYIYILVYVYIYTHARRFQSAFTENADPYTCSQYTQSLSPEGGTTQLKASIGSEA